MRYFYNEKSNQLFVSENVVDNATEITKKDYVKISSQNIIKAMLNKYGEDTQIDVAIEEMSELIKELVKYKRAKVYESENNPRRQYVLEEMGDVFFMMEYLKYIFDISEDEIDKIILEKSKRTGERYL